MANSPTTRRPGPQARPGGRNAKNKQSFLQQNWVMISSVGTIVLGVIIIIVLVAHSATPDFESQIGKPVPQSVLDAVTKPDPGLLTSVRGGGQTVSLVKLANMPIRKGANGKPEFFYVGGEYCPYCAADRWSYVMALSRFGTFKGLELMASSNTDTDPATPTFTFVHSTYTSQYLDFTPIEQANRDGQALQKLTDAQTTFVTKYDNQPYLQSNGIPFISIGDQFIHNGSAYDPALLSGLDWNQVVQKLSDTSDPVSKGIIGNANYDTAAICLMTNNQPGSVCSTPLITDLEKILQNIAGK